jgi:thioredoxin-like negative regulator of GroEL
VIETGNAADISRYIAGDKKTVVFFEITGCPFCAAYQSRFKEFVEKHSGECELLRVKLDEYDNPLWQKYGIEATPTVIAFVKGQIVARADAVHGMGLSKKKWAEFCACIQS